MKIIKEGKLPEKTIYHAKCRNCCTVFEFERGEATIHSDQRDGNYLEVECPFCYKTTYVDL